MYLKIEITGDILVKTGLHIHNPDGFSAIGTVDSPVSRDSLSGLPIIPGSSLKGKMRSLLVRSLQETPLSSNNLDHDPEKVIKLFGSQSVKGRLLFSDSILSNLDDLKSRGAEQATEVKYENTINRLTAVANPRQIERVIHGAVFPLSIMYEFSFSVPPVKDKAEVLDPQSMVEDFALLAEGFQILEMDYLGGHGSRGYGKVSFESLDLKQVFPQQTPDHIQPILEECKKTLTGWKQAHSS